MGRRRYHRVLVSRLDVLWRGGLPITTLTRGFDHHLNRALSQNSVAPGNALRAVGVEDIALAVSSSCTAEPSTERDSHASSIEWQHRVCGGPGTAVKTSAGARSAWMSQRSVDFFRDCRCELALHPTFYGTNQVQAPLGSLMSTFLLPLSLSRSLPLLLSPSPSPSLNRDELNATQCLLHPTLSTSLRHSRSRQHDLDDLWFVGRSDLVDRIAQVSPRTQHERTTARLLHGGLDIPLVHPTPQQNA